MVQGSTLRGQVSGGAGGVGGSPNQKPCARCPTDSDRPFPQLLLRLAWVCSHAARQWLLAIGNGIPLHARIGPKAPHPQGVSMSPLTCSVFHVCVPMCHCACVCLCACLCVCVRVCVVTVLLRFPLPGRAPGVPRPRWLGASVRSQHGVPAAQRGRRALLLRQGRLQRDQGVGATPGPRTLGPGPPRVLGKAHALGDGRSPPPSPALLRACRLCAVPARANVAELACVLFL